CKRIEVLAQILMCYIIQYLIIFFFFQAEDGIRDKLVTGVQTCALPISTSACPRRRKCSGSIAGGVIVSTPSQGSRKRGDYPPLARRSQSTTRPARRPATMNRNSSRQGSQHVRVRGGRPAAFPGFALHREPPDLDRRLPGGAHGASRARRGTGGCRQDRARQDAVGRHAPPAHPPPVLRGARRGQGPLRV